MDTVAVDVAQGWQADDAAYLGWVRPERVQALEALGAVKDERVIRDLVLALGDPLWQVRRAAEEGLLAAGELAVLPLLEELTRRRAETHFTEGAWRVLKAVSSRSLRESLAPLLEALEDPEAWGVAPLEAGEVLGQVRREQLVGDGRVAPRLGGGLPKGRRR